jgi:hypothetical protein
VLPDDDRRYDIETCRSSEKCFKINDNTISAFVGSVIFSEQNNVLNWIRRLFLYSIYDSST